jgi:UDP-glucuronate decarboxylase
MVGIYYAKLFFFEGPRACYDEGKRVAESLAYSYLQQEQVEVRIARIFNTFGPRMDENDGRVVSNFIIQALNESPLTVYGDGSQTRCLQFVHDLIDGLLLLMHSNYEKPVNLGNTNEMSILDFANLVCSKLSRESSIVHLPAVTDDPQKRRPDTTTAFKVLQWKPRFSIEQGIDETVDYFTEYFRANRKSKAQPKQSLL